MTAPEPDLVDEQVLPEEVRPGDLLDGRRVDTVIVDPSVPDYVWAFTPDQQPLRRGRLVTVRRPRPTAPPAPNPLDELHAQLAEVRDLALAVADGTNTAAQRATVKAAADKVRGRGKA